MKRFKWHYREAQRLYRLLRPEASAQLLIDTVGAFWLFRHGAKREHKVRLFAGGSGWYCIDIAFPRIKLGLEAKGGYQKYYQGDIVRDQRLTDKGWQIVRISEAEMKKDPREVRRRVKELVKG